MTTHPELDPASDSDPDSHLESVSRRVGPPRWKPRTKRRLARFLSNPLGVVSVLVFAVLLAASLLAPFLTNFDPNTTDLSQVLADPSRQHPLGTDSAGRDIWSRLLYGGRTTFVAAAIAISVAAAIGIPAGLVAGYLRGWCDAVLSWTASVILAAPTIVILLAARAVVGTNMVITMAVLGALISPAFFRLVRSLVRAASSELYVDAARVAGLTDADIIWRHLLVAIRAPLIIQAVEIAGVAISIQAGLEFLGLGDPAIPNWGMMLNEGFRNVYLAPAMMVWPALAIVLVVVSLAIAGNALRDAFEATDASPKRRRRATARPRGRSVAHVPASRLSSPEPNADGAPDANLEPALAAPDAPVAELRDVSLGYPSADGTAVVLDGVTLRIGPGEIVGLVGESGSGKTQIALSLLGLLPAQAEVLSGSVRVAGTELVDARSGKLSQAAITPLRGRAVGYIPQEPMANLDANTRIGTQLARPLRRTLGLSRSSARARVLELLRAVGLHDPARVAESYSWQISGGMAQRVLIAAALGGNPSLLVADEPTTALDVSVQAGVLDLLHDLREDTGAALLIVTHDFGVVADICDRVVVLQHGRVVEQGTTREVLAHPTHPYTASLLAANLAGREPLTKIDIDIDIDTSLGGRPTTKKEPDYA